MLSATPTNCSPTTSVGSRAVKYLVIVACFHAFVCLISVCDSWYNMTSPPASMVSAARFGHSAVLRHTPATEHYSMLVLGGFNGQMLNSSSLEFHLGTCIALTSNVTCMAARIGVECVWIEAESKCVSADSAPMSDPDITVTCRIDDDTSIVSLFRQNYEFCRSLTHCATCLAHNDCEWCDTGFCFGKDSGLCAKVTILTNSV